MAAVMRGFCKNGTYYSCDYDTVKERRGLEGRIGKWTWHWKHRRHEETIRGSTEAGTATKSMPSKENGVQTILTKYDNTMKSIGRKRPITPRYSSWGRLWDWQAPPYRTVGCCQARQIWRYDFSTARSADDKVAEFILLSVMKNLSYDHIEYHEKLGRCPIGRTDFYGIRRLFFHYLDCALKAAGEESSACT